MKIKIIDKSYGEVMAEKREKHKKPIKPNVFFRTLMRLVSIPDLKKTHFKVKKVGMDRLSKKENAFYLMNHSSFIDLEIVARLLYPKPFNIITTTDAFVGKCYLLRHIGCIPSKKFVHDPTLVRDIIYTAKKLKSNVILFPEVGYSFDGTATTIPETVAKLAKMLKIPLVMITTHGAFSRDPLYNNLQVRKVDVDAEMEYLYSPKELECATEEEINKTINEKFSFDNFRWQKENGVKISEATRADYLERVLYKCPVCKAEGLMRGRGCELVCAACGKKHTLSEYGELTSEDGTPAFQYVSDWYRWERECVKEELVSGTYSFCEEVEILMATDLKRVYRVGEGTLAHTSEGIRLTGCDGEISYIHKPLSSYSICVDFNWYEIGDMVGIGNHEAFYYCFPKNKSAPVAKVRLAAEELYKLLSEGKRK